MRLSCRPSVRGGRVKTLKLAALWLWDERSAAPNGPINAMPTEGVDHGCRAVTAAQRTLNLRSPERSGAALVSGGHQPSRCRRPCFTISLTAGMQRRCLTAPACGAGIGCSERGLVRVEHTDPVPSVEPLESCVPPWLQWSAEARLAFAANTVTVAAAFARQLL
jgi:hypothetical protein